MIRFLKSSFILASFIGFSTLPAQAKVETGTSVADLTVTDSHGNTHNLSDFAGKTVILEWTNHGCPYVKKHYNTGNMQATQTAALTDEDTVWLSVFSSAPGRQGHVTGEQANMITAEKNASPTALILDPKGDAGHYFSAKTTPHMFIIDANQTLIYQGAIDSNPSASPKTIDGATNYVLAALAELKAGQPITIAETDAYGC